MIVGKAIYYLLTNATGVTDIVSTRIYPEVAQQDAALPYIVYNVANNEPTDTKPEPSKLDTAQVEVNIYSDSYTEAIDLAVAVRAALDRVKGTYNGVNVQSIQYLNEIIDFDEPQRAYNINADYDVRISRSGFEIAQGSPITGVELGDLSDVDVSGVTNGQLIAYNSTTGNWEAADDAGGAETLGALNDVDVDNPSGGQSIMWDAGSNEWVKDSRTTVLFDQLKQGSETSIKNGAGADSELKLEQTKATVQTGVTKVVLTETSPGDIEFVVATDADGNTAFTALHLDGTTTADVADFIVKSGCYFKLEHGGYTQWIRPSAGTTQDTVIILPNKSGVLGRAEDIPTSVTDLTDVTSAGSGAIITDAERTNLTTNTAKVGLIAGGTTGQALVKSTDTDYDVEWADIAVDVQYHDRYATEAGTLRSGATATVELYYTAQADGDGYAESAESDTATTGFDIRRKLYYSEAAQADPDTGTWVQFADIADDTTFASAKATLLAYLKERTGGTVPISLKMTWEEVAEASLLLDTYTGAAAAYSLRQLRTAYTGDAIRVRRASDNTEQDIGFDGSGELDTTSLASFCSGTDGFVKTWYDQASTNDATQTTAANQPKIYDSSTGVVTENGKPAVEFDGSNDSLTISNDSLHKNVSYSHLYSVNASDVTGVVQTYYFAATGDNANSKSRVNLAILNTNKANSGGRRLDTDSGGSVTSSATLSANTQYIRTAEFDFATSDLHQYLNGSLDGTTTAFQTDGNTSDTDSLNASGANITIGTLGGTVNKYNGTLQEILVYTSDQSANRTNIEDNINTFYSIY